MTVFVLLGCPTGSGTDPANQAPVEPQEEQDAKTLKNTLGSAATVSNTTVTLNTSIIIDKAPDVLILNGAVARDAQDTPVLAIGTLSIPSGVTFVVAPDLTVTVKPGATITASGTVTLAAKSGAAEAGGKIAVAGGSLIVEPSGIVTLAAGTSASGGGKIEVAAGGTLEVKADKASGKVVVEANAELTVAGGSDAGTLKVAGVIDIKESAVVAVDGNLEPAGGKIDIAPKAKVEVTGAVGSGDIQITGDGEADLSKANIKVGAKITAPTDLVIKVQAVTDLAAAVDKAKAIANGKGVVQLTEAFYSSANSLPGPLVIDAGADNLIPYTIKGLGKDSTSSLSVGVLLANDNVTLDGVNINVNGSNVPTVVWTESSNYSAAVLIGRVATGTTLLTGADAPSKGVSVINSSITITNSTATFTAGMWVQGASNNGTLYNPRDITISDNTISATGNAGYATQGILLRGYDYSIKITGNTISAQYGAPQTGKRYGAPASALFFNRVYGEDLMGSGTPEISGNTLTLGTNSAYSFFINAYETSVEDTINQNGGVAVLRGDNFSVAGTTWALSTATDKTSSYKKLFNALLDNIIGTGFGSISIPQAANSFDFEHYNIENGKVTRISVLGDHIVSGKYIGDSKANAFGTNGGAPAGVDYGSFEVENEAVKGEKTGKFYFTYDTSDTDYTYNN
jgi:hypothetical protein